MDHFSHALYLVPSVLSGNLIGSILKAVEGSETAAVAMNMSLILQGNGSFYQPSFC